MMRIGSLFSGAGGLDLAVEHVFGGRVQFVAEIEPAPSKVLAHRFPDAVNLGDVELVDWDTVEPVDVLCGGFPCQDVSLAGKRAGMRLGTRSGLWAEFARAIHHLRPRWVVIENVRGLLSAEAHSEMEPDPWDLGDGSRGPALRALGAVLGDLANLGYDARWLGLRAADAGAPHGRYRIFVLAWPRDSAPHSDGGRGRGRALAPGHGSGAESDSPTHGADPRADRAPSPDAEGIGSRQGLVGVGDQAELARARRDRDTPRGDAESDGSGAGSATEDADISAGGQRGVSAPRQAEGRRARADARRRDRAPSPDAVGLELARERGERQGRGATPGDRPSAADADGGRLGVLGGLEPGRRDADGRGREDGSGSEAEPSAPAPDAVGGHRERRGGSGSVAGEARQARDEGEPDPLGDAPHDRGATPSPWGEFEPAIRRWEHDLGRQAPPPTLPDGQNGQHRLSPWFVEWMMGWPLGWVNALELFLTRGERLRILGNGVVPQQAALALRTLLREIGGIS